MVETCCSVQTSTFQSAKCDNIVWFLRAATKSNSEKEEEAKLK